MSKISKGSIYILILNDFFFLLLSRLSKLVEKHTNPISAVQELIKVKVRGRIIQMTTFFLP